MKPARCSRASEAAVAVAGGAQPVHRQRRRARLVGLHGDQRARPLPRRIGDPLQRLIDQEDRGDLARGEVAGGLGDG